MCDMTVTGRRLEAPRNSSAASDRGERERTKHRRYRPAKLNDCCRRVLIRCETGRTERPLYRFGELERLRTGGSRSRAAVERGAPTHTGPDDVDTDSVVGR